ncbi:MAG: hypothetical protein IAI50_16595 [Candidatus Eremiobacteraeota bacterium]|nr:hypothetical protein [Candidatus Eremiobacteraeota bacterium]
MTLPVSYEDVEAAAERIADYVVRTPSLYAAALSEKTGVRVSLKLEMRQRTSSFKDRGRRTGSCNWMRTNVRAA